MNGKPAVEGALRDLTANTLLSSRAGHVPCPFTVGRFVTYYSRLSRIAIRMMSVSRRAFVNAHIIRWVLMQPAMRVPATAGTVTLATKRLFGWVSNNRLVPGGQTDRAAAVELCVGPVKTLSTAPSVAGTISNLYFYRFIPFE